MSAEVPYETYSWLRAHRAEVSSWAVWANPPTRFDPNAVLEKKGIGEVGFFEVPDEQAYWAGVGRALRRDIVIVGLSRAAREENGVLKRDDRLFGSFHDTDLRRGQDFKLRAVAHHWGLWGAYITDLDPISVETSSDSKIAKANLSEPDHRAKCANMLEETFKILAPPPDSLLVMLGNDVEAAFETPEFKDKFDSFPPKRRRKILHYSSQHGHQSRIVNAESILGNRQDINGLWVPETRV